jgi:hypothetical protein
VRSLRIWIALAAVLVSAGTAFAHQSSVVYSDVDVRGATVHYAVQIASADLFEALGTREITQDLLRARKDIVYDYVSRRIGVSGDGHACPPRMAGFDIVNKTDGFFAGLTMDYVCEHKAEALRVRYDLFFDLDPRHQGFARLDLHDGQTREFVFRAGNRDWDVARPISALEHAGDFLVMGIEHIFTGYDHILFLAGLLVLAGITEDRARGLRKGLLYTLKIVTAFTLAHSITLIAAALGVVNLPTRLSESGIALSIVYIGIENLALREPRHRWLLTFVFGLVHGFGFATVLRQVGLPKHGLLLSLVSFNVGVELGQMAIVAALFPLLHLIATRSVVVYRRAVLTGGSLAIAALGMFWLIERVFSVRLLGGLLGG